MIIRAFTDSKEIPASKAVKELGRYLYKNIDSAYNQKSSGNTYDVYMTVYYQVPEYMQVPWMDDQYNDLQEMNILLNLTTYQNKIRINILVNDENEKTLGYYLLPPETLHDIEKAKEKILNIVRKRLNKEFEDYEFIF